MPPEDHRQKPGKTRRSLATGVGKGWMASRPLKTSRGKPGIAAGGGARRSPGSG